VAIDEEATMRFLVLVKANEQSEAGLVPAEQEFIEVGKFNQRLVNAGVLLAAEGLRPSSTGARIDYTGPSLEVTDGPFAEAKELVGGFWILQTRDQDEAIEWMKRAPFAGGQVEIRQIAEADDLREALHAPGQRG